MHEQSHSVIRLAVHLPYQQNCIFREGEEDQALNIARNSHSQLESWFQLNRVDPEAHQYKYSEIPYHYVFHKKTTEWKRRQRGADKIISRLYSAQPKEGERFYLRVLLLHVPGATSYEDLRTVNGVVLDSFREACLQRNLLQDDREWENTLNEAALVRMPRKLRQLFSTMLTHCEIHNPLLLWQMFKNQMIEDYLRNMSEHDAEQAALSYIDKIIKQAGKCLSDFNLPQVENVIVPDDIINLEGMATEAAQVRDMLNPKQVAIATAFT